MLRPFCKLIGETKMKSYKVMREHQGDKEYVEGDIRKANQIDVQHLVDRGTLVLIDDEATDNDRISFTSRCGLLLK